MRSAPTRGSRSSPNALGSPNAKPSYLTLAEVDEDQGQLWFAKQIKADYGASVFADSMERSGLHEDQRLTVPRRHGVRRPGRALQAR